MAENISADVKKQCQKIMLFPQNGKTNTTHTHHHKPDGSQAVGLSFCLVGWMDFLRISRSYSSISSAYVYLNTSLSGQKRNPSIHGQNPSMSIKTIITYIASIYINPSPMSIQNGINYLYGILHCCLSILLYIDYILSLFPLSIVIKVYRHRVLTK